MKISKKQAWELAQELGKTPPYKGYALDLGGGLVLSHTKRGEYIVIDFPVTPEKVEQFERENRQFIESLPLPDPAPLLARIRKQFSEPSNAQLALESIMRLEKAGRLNEVIELLKKPPQKTQ